MPAELFPASDLFPSPDLFPGESPEGETEMAEVVRVPQRVTPKGVIPTVISGMNSADTQVIANKNGDVILRIINGGTEPTNVTVATPGEVDGNAIADLVVSVVNATTKEIGPFDPATYNDKHGNLAVTLSKVTTVTMEVTRVAL
jgi:hypothetical protein